MAKTAIERYRAAAMSAGCPKDQVRNFLNAGAVLMPQQLKFAASARLCDVPGGPTKVGFGGARGGGKSYIMFVQIAADDCQRYDGLKCLLLRKVGRSLKEGFEDLMRQAARHIDYEYVPSQRTMMFKNDSRILLGHFKDEKDIDAYLGLEYDLIGLEEATTLSVSKVKAIRTCLRTSKSGWRPREYSTTNPGGIGHAHYKEVFIDPYLRGTETDTRFIPATVEDNPFLNDEYRQTLDSLTGWQKRAWRFGEWDIAAGQFFTTFRRDTHVIPWFQVPENWRVWCALDYGFTHYTVVYLLAEGDGCVYLLDEHAERKWLPSRHAEAIHAMLQRNNVSVARLSTFVAGADVFSKESRGETIADEYRKLGFTLVKADNSRISGAANLLSRLGDPEADVAPRLLVTNMCTGFINTLPLLQHDPHRPEDVLKWDTDDDGSGGDDWYDAARYGIQAASSKSATGVSVPGLWKRR